MSKAMEDMITDERVRFAVKLLQRGKDTIEEISELTGLSVNQVQEIKEQLKPVSA